MGITDSLPPSRFPAPEFLIYSSNNLNLFLIVFCWYWILTILSGISSWGFISPGPTSGPAPGPAPGPMPKYDHMSRCLSMHNQLLETHHVPWDCSLSKVMPNKILHSHALWTASRILFWMEAYVQIDDPITFYWKLWHYIGLKTAFHVSDNVTQTPHSQNDIKITHTFNFEFA